MNLVLFLTSQVFTVDGQELDLSLVEVLHEKPQRVERITLSLEAYKKYFGCHNGNHGELVKRWPGLFRNEIVKMLHPNTSTDYARYLICLNLLETHIFYYARPRQNSNGEPCFSEYEGFELAKNSYKPYVLMEDLS